MPEKRRNKLALILAILGALALAGSWRATSTAASSTAGDTPGPIAANAYRLVDGRIITPAGHEMPLGGLPLNAVLSPDGKELLVSQDGRYEQDILVVSTASSQVIQTIPYPFPESLFVGLAFNRTGTEAYASGGAQNVVHTYSVSSDGMLTPGPDISLVTPTTPNPFPAGMALVGERLFVAEENARSVAVIDVRTNQVIKILPAGSRPYTVVAGFHDRRLYVSNWASHWLTVMDPRALLTDTRILVSAHPTFMVEGPHQYLYVADTNADKISIIFTQTNHVVDRISVRLFPHALLGSSPQGMAVSPNGKYLYVACAGANAVAVIGLRSLGRHGKVLGWIPTAEYPTSATLGPSGRQLFVLNGEGDGPTANGDLNDGHYHNPVNGTLSIFGVPDLKHLKRLSRRVAVDDNIKHPGSEASSSPSRDPFAAGASPIQHVIYIVKENQTYDQVFGDIGIANGDRSLTKYPATVTPNLHDLAARFGIFDNFYDDGQSSADGHNWAMSANDDDFNMKMWPETYGHRIPNGYSQGVLAADLSPGGYLWDRAAQAGITYRDYGEFFRYTQPGYTVINTSDASQCPGPLAYHYFRTHVHKGKVVCLPPSSPRPTVPALIGHSDVHYRGDDPRYSDGDRFLEWDSEFQQFVANHDLPNLEIIALPGDHTQSTAPRLPTPASYVALNDQAVGKIVDAVSHSPYWSSTAIFITQDDAQGAADHVNAQRTECLIISPYTQVPHPTVNSGLYDNNSMLLTIEKLLGLQPMSAFDQTATPMWSAFHTQPNLRPYSVRPLRIRITYNPPQTSS